MDLIAGYQFERHDSRLAESGLFGAGYPTLAPVGWAACLLGATESIAAEHRGMDIHWFSPGKANVGIRIHHEPLFGGQTGYPAW